MLFLCCLNITKYFKLDSYDVSDITYTCADLRNQIDHGDKEAKVDGYIANCFALLRAITYSMYLKRWGLSENEIAKQINNLYML